MTVIARLQISSCKIQFVKVSRSEWSCIIRSPCVHMTESELDSFCSI